jgi:hypothetical protein
VTSLILDIGRRRSVHQSGTFIIPDPRPPQAERLGGAPSKSSRSR